MRETIEQLCQAAYVLLDGDAGDYDPLLANVGEAHLVLLGAASYGSHELFHARAHITRRLICERGFTAVALGADVASTARINSYVRGVSDDTTANEALRDFHAYPNWLLRNAEMLDFVGWLREYNDHFLRNIKRSACTDWTSITCMDRAAGRRSHCWRRSAPSSRMRGGAMVFSKTMRCTPASRPV